MICAAVDDPGNSDDTLAPVAQPEPEPTLPDASPTPWQELAVVVRDRYESRGAIAAGGIGRIVAMFDKRLRREVAIKELHDGADAVATERFMREALVTARLQHPNIMPVYEAGRWPSGEPFYAMKLVEGRPLRTVIAEARTLADRLGLLPHVLDCAQAVAFAHSQGVIHRDLKPANVMIGSFGETVVIDWGLAKALDDDRPDSSSLSRPAMLDDDRSDLTLDGTVFGTPAYMSPEQAAGKRVDTRADVYSLGAMLYHVLAGHPPYVGGNWIEVLGRVLLGPPPALEQQERRVPHELGAIVGKAMGRNADDRYADAGELAADLRAFLDGRIVGAHRYSAWQRTVRFARRFRTLLAAAAVLVVVGSYSVVEIVRAQSQTALQRDHAEHARDEAEHARDEAEHARDDAMLSRREALRRADERTLEQARTAARRVPNHALALLKSLTPEFSRWSAAQLVAADAVEHGLVEYLRRCADADLGACPRARIQSLAFDPDGTSVVATHSDGTVARYDATSGTMIGDEVAVCEAFVASGLPGTDALLIGCRDGAVHHWQSRDAGSRELGRHGDMVTSMVPISAGRVVSMGLDHALRLWDPATGTGTLLAQCARMSEVETAPFVISGDGTKAVCLQLDRGVVVLDMDGRVLAATREHPTVLELATDHEARRVAWGTSREGVSVWDRDTDRTTTFPQTQGVSRLALTADGKRLAMGTHSGQVRVWALPEGAAHSLPSHAGTVNSVHFIGDSALLSTGGDGVAQRVQLDGGRELVIGGGNKPAISAIVEAGSHRLAVRNTDTTVWLWTSTPAQSVIVREPHSFVAMAPTDDPDRVVVGTADGELLEIAVSDGATMRRLEIGNDPVRRIVASPRWIVAGDNAGHVVVYDRQWREHWRDDGEGIVVALALDVDDRRLAVVYGSAALDVVTLDDGVVQAVEVLPRPTGAGFLEDGRLAVASGTGELALLSPELALVWRSRAHSDEVWHLALSVDTRTAVTVGRDRLAVLHDLELGTDRAVEMPYGAFESAFVDDDRSVLTRSRDYVLRRIDVDSAEIVETFVGHGGHIEGFDVQPGLARFASASVDDTVRIWDLASGEHRVLHGHTDAVEAVLLRPSHGDVISISRDGTMRRWLDDVPADGDGLRAWLGAHSDDTVDEFR